LIVDPDQKLSYFHSMRHSISGAMGRAKVSIEASEAALGHKFGGGDRERYMKLKHDPVQLSAEAFEPGLVELAQMVAQSK
jgi:hypothetical protein